MAVVIFAGVLSFDILNLLGVVESVRRFLVYKVYVFSVVSVVMLKDLADTLGA